MFVVRDDGLYFDERRLGPRDGLYVDSSELRGLGVSDGVKHLRMPGRVDGVCALGDLTLGYESKVWSDLVTSIASKRLARQIRTLRKLVDVPALLVRGGVGAFTAEFDWVWDELVRLQALGVVILPGPKRDEDVPARIATYRTFLTEGSRSAYAAVAGTDRRKPDEPYTSGRLLQAIRGIGAVTREKLHKRYGSTKSVFAASDEELRRDVSAAVVKRMREAME